MLNLGEYIHQLLKGHPELGVPGIGLFKRTRVPARFDKESCSFVPPRYVVTLQALDGDDSLLLDKIAEREHINLEEARGLLDISVNGLLADLEEQSTVTLEGVGYLQYEEGTLSLTGVDEAYAGLSPVKELSEVAAATDEASPDQGDTLTPTPPEPNEAEAPVEPVNDSLIEEAIVEEEYLKENKDTLQSEDAPYEVMTPEYEEPQEQAKKPSSWAWLISGIILVGIVLAGWWYLDQRKVAEQGLAVKNDQIARMREADSLAQKGRADSVEAARLLHLKADSVRKDSLAADSLRRAGKGQLSYEIIVASFPDVPMAEEYVARMNKQGYHMRVILSKMPGNLKKVSCGSFLRKEDADTALAKVQRTFAKEAWIARIKN